MIISATVPDMKHWQKKDRQEKREMYNEKIKKNILNYRKNNQKTLTLSYRKDDYEKIVKPAIMSSNVPLATFVKEAIAEKLLNDGYITQEEFNRFPGIEQ